jgi:hypothetical protein
LYLMFYARYSSMWDSAEEKRRGRRDRITGALFGTEKERKARMEPGCNYLNVELRENSGYAIYLDRHRHVIFCFERDARSDDSSLALVR